jgi:hypothetical protein
LRQAEKREVARVADKRLNFAARHAEMPSAHGCFAVPARASLSERSAGLCFCRAHLGFPERFLARRLISRHPTSSNSPAADVKRKQNKIRL